MKNKLLICSDFDSESGLGHLSRAQTFFDAIEKESYEIHLCSEMNPNNFGLKIPLLDIAIWKPFLEAKTEKYSVIYIDTYDSNILEQIKIWDVNRKILLLDSNFRQSIPCWPDFVIDLERTSPRHFGNYKYLHGTALIGSAIQKLKRSELSNRIQGKFPSKVVVNLGGSNRALKYLMKFNSIFKTQTDIQFVIFCSSVILPDLETNLRSLDNTIVKCIGDEYFSELMSCDLLITSSGSSFLEAIYMKIPTVIFDLFENARLNFETFRKNSNVLYSGGVDDLDGDWFMNLSITDDRSNFFADYKSLDDQLNFIDVEMLKSALISIL